MALAAEEKTVASLSAGIDGVWVMISAVLVLLMQAGFILLETGSTRMKNAGHVAGKTIFTVGLSSIVFWLVSYGLIFGKSGNGFVGWGDFFYSPVSSDPNALSPFIFFMFQMAFATISLSVAFGGFAERAKLSTYLVFSILFTALVYPVIAHWIWGGGWLSTHGKQDFAGSTVVHLTGAMAALAATILLKPRIGKYNKNGTPNEIHGHNQVFSSLGIFILWIGWFGFNAGSTLAVGDGFFGFVALNTHLAAGAGALSALLISWVVNGKADITSILNGALGSLVAITASCAFVETWAAVVIGFIAGLLVFFGAKLFEKWRLDDPIYAISAHGVAGVWGTLSSGLFATPELAAKVGVGQGGLFYTGSFEQLWVQAYGVLTAGGYAFVVSFAILYVMKRVMGLRVTEEEEIVGLDLSEHGSYGYPEHMKAASIEPKTEALKVE
ncbi:ammonium transporter [Paenibacillus sp. N1-5-1-14]|nr:ammonium transporter [Paenibacillus radicibacter]MCR8642630.1 ammonium transporter [Paenibacillus radicibacter]